MRAAASTGVLYASSSEYRLVTGVKRRVQASHKQRPSPATHSLLLVSAFERAEDDAYVNSTAVRCAGTMQVSHVSVPLYLVPCR